MANGIVKLCFVLLLFGMLYAQPPPSLPSANTTNTTVGTTVSPTSTLLVNATNSSSSSSSTSSLNTTTSVSSSSSSSVASTSSLNTTVSSSSSTTTTILQNATVAGASGGKSSSYLQLTIFGLIALFIPLSMLLFSRMVRKSPGNNEVQRSPYESAEESTGQRVEIMHEYLHYFTMFLAFEVLGVIVILWSTFSRVGQASSGIYIASLLVFGLIFEIFMLMMAKNKGE